MKKLLALLLLLATVVSAQQTAGTVATTTTPVLDPNQVYSTGNVVQMTTTTTGSTWVNGVYQDQLTCWGWGNPGNCGPNPTVRPGNYINYSFGYTDLYQVQAISSILPQTGLRVNGYTFGFTAKNGNGWDDGRVDQLNAYVAFYGTDGKVVDYTNYDLNSKFNWTTFSYSKDFVTPYADKDLSTVRYGFTGKDNNFWAGTYGPEIMNVNFSLKYSVDACAVNVLSSPTCPGYTEALLKSIPTTTNTDTATTTVATAPLPPPEAALPPPPPPPAPPSTANSGQPSVVAPVVSAPAPPPPGPAPSANSSAASSQPTKEVAGKETTGSGGGNVSLALSVISKNSERDAAGAAVAQSAVAQAQATANQAQQEAVSVAAQAVSNSVTAGQAALKSESGNSGSSRSASTASIQSDILLQSAGQVNLVMGPTASNNNNSSAQKQEQTISPITIAPNTQNSSSVQTVQSTLVNNNDSNRGSVTATQPVSTALPVLPPQQSQVVVATPLPTNTSATQQQTTQEQPQQTQSIYSLLPPQQPTLQLSVPQMATVDVSQQPTNTIQQTTQSNTSEVVAMLSPNMLTDKTNPLTDIVEAKQNIPQSTTTTTSGPSVNKNAGDNDVAGGVSINKMATAPAGYGDYLNFVMRDVAFYAPKEVYKNQRNVDNARALRLLTNDSKHKEMVEMQYAK